MSLGFLGLHLLSIQSILFHSASPAATRVRPALLFYQRCAFSSLLGFWSLCLALAASSSLPPTYTRAKLKKIFAFQIIGLVILPWMVLLHAHYPSVASHCCRKEDPFQGPKLGSRLTLGKELSEETHVLTKEESYWERAPGFHPGGEQEGEGTQENCSAMWLTVLGLW